MLTKSHCLSNRMRSFIYNCRSNFKGTLRQSRQLSANSFIKSLMPRLHNTRAIDKAETLELNTLKVLKPLCISMKDITLGCSHPLHNVAKEMKNTIDELDMDHTTGRDIVMRLAKASKDQFIANAAAINLQDIDNCTFDEKQHYETYVRTLFLYRYLNRMISALSSSNNLTDSSASEMDEESVKDKAQLLRLVDSMLRGSSAERVAEHMRIYCAPEVMHWQLQNCFYMLFESEIESITTAWLRESARHRGIPLHDEMVATEMTKYIDAAPPEKPINGIGGRIRKIFRKTPKWKPKSQDEKLFAANVAKLKNFHKEYLLDKLELNVKSRCVFAWTDPTYKGFTPLEDNQLVPLEDLIRGRRKYFSEASDVSRLFVDSYMGSRIGHYNSKREFKMDAKKGFAYFIVCCILDVVVCNL